MDKNTLTQARLKEALHYDPETGIFTWLCSHRNRVRVGAKAGTEKEGYIQIGINRKYYYAHRLAWLYMTGRFPDGLLDHEDTNKSNNKFSNLREATYSQNTMNAPAPCTNTSGVKGVHWSHQARKWRAQFVKDGGYHYIGLFESIEEAAEAVRLKRLELHGEFANHG